VNKWKDFAEAQINHQEDHFHCTPCSTPSGPKSEGDNVPLIPPVAPPMATYLASVLTYHFRTRGKVLSWEYRSPRKRNSRPSSTPTILNAHCPQHAFHSYSQNKIYHSLFVARTWQHFIDLLKRKNPRFTAFLDSNLHTGLAIVTKNELGLAFPLGTFPKNFVQIRPRFI